MTDLGLHSLRGAAPLAPFVHSIFVQYFILRIGPLWIVLAHKASYAAGPEIEVAAISDCCFKRLSHKYMLFGYQWHFSS